MFWPRGPLASRDLGCANMEPKRARETCRALSETLAWTWLGHAVITPGWRVTWNGLRRVYCGEQVSEADVPALEAMTRASDWRLQSGAGNLLRLVAAAVRTRIVVGSSLLSALAARKLQLRFPHVLGRAEGAGAPRQDGRGAPPYRGTGPGLPKAAVRAPQLRTLKPVHLAGRDQYRRHWIPKPGHTRR